MMKYGAIMTSRGVAKMANAAANGQKLNVTQIAVGDGGGVTPVPDPEQTKLVNQVRIGPLNMLNVDPDNASQIIAEQVIPEDDGGYFIREIGLFDDEGELIAVANCPVTEKPVYKQGSGRTLTVRMVLMVSSTSAVTLKIDPSVVLATRQYVDDAVAGSLPAGIPQPWPLTVPPTGWLKCNGAAFDKTRYPKLATAYPSGNLPDLRGEFLRGWDDGRGVDAGRALLSWQAASVIEHSHELWTWTGANLVAGNVGANINKSFGLQAGSGDGGMLSSWKDGKGTTDNTKRNSPTDKVRGSSGDGSPRNIAFNYIVRAA